MTAADP